MSISIKKDYIKPSKWSRPQAKINKVLGVVVHWVANAGSSAQSNRNFFNNRTGTYGSAHYIVGLEGEIVQALPDNEMGYHVGSRTYSKLALKELGSYPNATTIGIEMTHPDYTGKPNEKTYKSTIMLASKLLKEHGLTEENLWTHQEVVMWKECPRWYARNPEDWKTFKKDVAKELGRSQDAKPKKGLEIVIVEPDVFGMYTVQKGDTLWGISQALDIPVDAIKELNPKVNPSSLYIGQKIKVKSVKVNEYSIKKGDTLWGLARKFDTTVERLRQLNKGLEAKTLQVGAKIIVSKYVVENTDIKDSGTSQAKSTKKTHDHKFSKLGRIKGSVWSHTKPDLTTATRKEVINQSNQVKVCCEENGLYYTDSGWISKKYVEIVGDAQRIDLPHVVLRKGSRGVKVVQVQRALNKLNFKCGKEDGVFGAGTENALKRFQMVHDARHVDGVYGARTEKLMENMLNN